MVSEEISKYTVNQYSALRPLQFNILFLELTLALDRVGRSACKAIK